MKFFVCKIQLIIVLLLVARRKEIFEKNELIDLTAEEKVFLSEYSMKSM